MKKKILNALAFLTIAVTLSSCATIFGGQVSTCQRTRPAAGQPAREIRGGALVADILLFWPGAVIDFATGAITDPATAIKLRSKLISYFQAGIVHISLDFIDLPNSYYPAHF